MKQLRLSIPEDGSAVRLDPDRDALWINNERYPRIVRFGRDGRELQLADSGNSGTLHVVADVEGYGEVVLHTSIVMLRSDPYRLLVELARGQANRLRNLVADWERGGWVFPERLQPTAKELAATLCQAVQAPDDATANQASARLIQISTTFGDDLVVDHARGAFQARLARGERLAIGCVVRARPKRESTSTFLQDAVDSVFLPIDWRRVETERGVYDWTALDEEVDWACRLGLSPTIGPILDFHDGCLPKWIEQSRNDPETLVTLLVDVVETVVGRYGDRVKSWIVSTATNSNQSLGLTAEQAEWLTARLLIAARQVDSEARLAMGVDQPWGWYVGTVRGATWPVEFIEGVYRNGVRPHAVLVQLSCGFDQPNRTAADVSKLLDRFRRLDVPVWAEFCAPSIDRRFGVEDQQRQADWLERQFLASLAKPTVERVNWGELLDEAGGRQADGGLLRADETPKASAARFAQIRNALGHSAKPSGAAASPD